MFKTLQFCPSLFSPADGRILRKIHNYGLASPWSAYVNNISPSDDDDDDVNATTDSSSMHTPSSLYLSYV